jgi:uncharacterized protein YbjT (DUF2867 family)
MQDGRIAMVDARDVAAAALTAPGHTGQTHVITGPEALSHAMVAAILSEALGRRIVYRDIALDALREQLVAAPAPRPGSSRCGWNSRPSCARASRRS